MILVLAGTRDGRQLAAALQERGYAVLVSVVTAYGAQLAAADGLTVNAGALDEAALRDLLRRHGVTCVIDATHPYAAHISATAQRVCVQAALPYLRYERAASPLPRYEKLRVVPDWPAAAVAAAQGGDVIFLAIGSRHLEVLATHPALRGKRLVARVLPDAGAVHQCLALGLAPADIAAMQGPFSLEMNTAMFRHFGAQVLVTKNSGPVGGTDSKISAAMDLNMAVVVVARPTVPYRRVATSLADVEKFLQEEQI